MSALQWEHGVTEGAKHLRCARRILLRDLDFFFLGTAIES
ncbi:MAG: hypothetical protein JWQ35_1779 [Bacteriovoracaceae bacterium]|nr:hypothetical protein [Bacteriovoracaceae bacterium]